MTQDQLRWAAALHRAGAMWAPGGAPPRMDVTLAALQEDYFSGGVDTRRIPQSSSSSSSSSSSGAGAGGSGAGGEGGLTSSSATADAAADDDASAAGAAPDGALRKAARLARYRAELPSVAEGSEHAAVCNGGRARAVRLVR